MIDYLNIGGKNRPVRFGTNTLRIYSEQYKIPITKVGNLSKQSNLGEIIGLFYWGLKDGARAEKQEFDFTIDIVSDWFDEDVTLLEKLMQIYLKQYVGNPQKPEDKAGI